MIVYSGYLRMMEHCDLSPVQYHWAYATYADEGEGKKTVKSIAVDHLSEQCVNDWVGHKISLSTNGKIRCVDCGRPSGRRFIQGSCYVCFTTKAKNDMCILKPETCHFFKGTCREPDWGKTNCFKKHTVYFANSSGLKVGITKENPISNRWVDQGARFAVPVLEVDSRFASGMIEKYLAGFLPDKTSWQKLIKGDPPPFDLLKEKEKFLKHLSSKEFQMEGEGGKSIPVIWKESKGDHITEITYPVISYPGKLKSLKLSESEPITDTLIGVKGQYLLFESGAINIRSHEGYHTTVQIH